MATYNRQGNSLTNGNSILKICTRKKVTEKKPKHFLISVQGKKRKYISSLYGEAPQFSFEYQGKRYSLTLSENHAVIERGGVYVSS